MLLPKKVQIKINAQNRLKYEERLGTSLIKGQLVTISQFMILETSRLKVECQCDFCGVNFLKERVNVKKKTFCNNNCKNKYLRKSFSGENNPNPKKDKIPVRCFICDKQFDVFESKSKKQDIFLCSRDCYKEHRRDNYNKDNIYNYQDVETSCTTCEKKFKTSKWYLETKKNLFCTQECYWSHRKNFYKEFYYNDDLNNSRLESAPEKKVREWLQEKPVKFKAECGFLRKYFVDFYLPEYKLIIEVYGDYWHVNPQVYDVDNNNSELKILHKNQRDFVDSKYDLNRVNELESYGYKVVWLWEKDINENLDFHMNNLFENEMSKINKNP